MKRPAWNLLTGTLTRYALLFVNIAIGIFLMPFTMHHLGKAQYGLWMLVASMTAYLQLLDLGYGNGLVRQLTHADARGDRSTSRDAGALRRRDPGDRSGGRQSVQLVPHPRRQAADDSHFRSQGHPGKLGADRPPDDVAQQRPAHF